MAGRMNILFVCTGNTCRSPMAEHLLKKKLAEVALDHVVDVHSAGISAVFGAKASKHAIEVLRQRNHPQLELHRSTPVSREMVEQADLILTMTSAHKNMLSLQYPEHNKKLYTLLEYAQPSEDKKLLQTLFDVPSEDIADPYGGDLEQYKACANQLEQAIETLFQRIQQGLQ